MVELDGAAEVVAWDAAVRAAAPDEVADVVPAAATLLVVARDGADLAALTASLRSLRVRAADVAADASRSAEVEIPVRYDGPDLRDVARMTGLSEAQVVRAHTQSVWRVAFGGFAPGFGYLTGGDPRLHVPRRESARTAVPAGAVGLAGEYTGVYPRSSPGGWQLIGTTEAAMWDLCRDPPALLRPGAVVRFVEDRS
ncbi:5-oxoprolinase subunit PxpB [Mumia sp. ZJ1417]|nr:5-oxoprolinase subunit PxpB [Mumia sp. ZJ1417]